MGTNWSCWRWSDESEEDARNKAVEAAQQLAARMEATGGQLVAGPVTVDNPLHQQRRVATVQTPEQTVEIDGLGSQGRGLRRDRFRSCAHQTASFFKTHAIAWA